jgi:hypothetical protein
MKDHRVIIDCFCNTLYINVKTTIIHEQVFFHHQCVRRESHCYKISLFNDIYPFCIHNEMHLVTLVVFFLILHIVDSDNSLFCRNNDVFLLIFGIKYVKYLCNSFSENPRFIHLYDPHFSGQRL